MKKVGTMQCTVVLEFSEGKSRSQRKRVALVRFHRSTVDLDRDELGLTLAEVKTLLQCVRSEMVNEQLDRFCAHKQVCTSCGERRRLHDSACRDLKTVCGNIAYVRPRWKACRSGCDGSRYVSPLKDVLPNNTTTELQWLHAKLGAMLPYRQACNVMGLLLPMSGRHNHVTVRNHTIAVSKTVETNALPRPAVRAKRTAELGIDVGYVRGLKGETTCGMAVVVAAVGPVGRSPRVWTSALSRSKALRVDMQRCLPDSGYTENDDVHVITDGATDLARVTQALPHKARWILDWAHIGRMLHRLDHAVPRTLTDVSHRRVRCLSSGIFL